MDYINLVQDTGESWVAVGVCVHYINLVQDTGESWVAVGVCVDYINLVQVCVCGLH